mmetsp:Transcript_96094/g.173381  ORF Transcript_96094/g.173381 Transcript_96094/m.173381 type:complete len:102 (+) Transcript_96094:841-1146(+)
MYLKASQRSRSEAWSMAFPLTKLVILACWLATGQLVPEYTFNWTDVAPPVTFDTLGRANHLFFTLPVGPHSPGKPARGSVVAEPGQYFQGFAAIIRSSKES